MSSSATISVQILFEKSEMRDVCYLLLVVVSSDSQVYICIGGNALQQVKSWQSWLAL